MLFNSFSYAVFVPIIFIIYWFMPHRFRWVLLLAASYYFYMSWNPKYIILILATTFISYITGIVIEQTENKLQKKVYLVLSVIFCMGILFIFKYFNFFIENLSSVLDIFTIKMHPITLKLLLPVGISFYTFQTMSYVIDVYRGDVQAEKHFGYYAAFISFFPQLVAGPIERTSNLLPQIKREQKFSEQKAFDGLKLMLWGYYKKLVVADTLAPYVDKVYNQLELYQGFSLMIVVFFFSLQIYCDFSGYSDIAIGTARLFGIDLIKNFDAPYFSKSVKEFWRRWHISLSTWFKDYVYIPLGGNRRGVKRHLINMMVVWFLTGLWHGAAWNFVLWGLYYGILLILEKYVWGKKLEQLPSFFRHLYTIVIVVTGFVLFVFDDMKLLQDYLLSMVGCRGNALWGTECIWYLKNYGAVLLAALMLAFPFYPWLCKKRDEGGDGRRMLISLAGMLGYLALFGLTTAYLVNDTYNPFLYFRF